MQSNANAIVGLEVSVEVHLEHNTSRSEAHCKSQVRLCGVARFVFWRERMQPICNKQTTEHSILQQNILSTGTYLYVHHQDVRVLEQY